MSVVAGGDARRVLSVAVDGFWRVSHTTGKRVMTEPTVVLVTGALTGIGLATAQRYASTGSRVVISGRRDGVGKELARKLSIGGSEVQYIRADVRYEDDLRRLVDATVERFGRLDVAVNNAGTDSSSRAGEFSAITEITPEMYAASFDTNVLGTLLSMKHELRVMREQRSGAIVNVSSILGVKGFPEASLYVAGKHAIIGLTRSAALEAAGYGVRVNAVGPGPVDTLMLNRVTGGSPEAKAEMLATIPLKRVGTPEDIARAIEFIGSPGAGFLTGQTIFLDGGITAA
jgi:NAD(P)-dependent dehydrogenase (short-subunit alcohol dehydrogenase family)